jgi:hypothetical protein
MQPPFEVMKKDNTGKKHIINVSAMEGKFTVSRKTDIRIPIWQKPL